jgi:hypothetical protein
VTDIEKPDGGACRCVLTDGARIGDWHQPAAELREAGAKLAMTFLEWAG